MKYIKKKKNLNIIHLNIKSQRVLLVFDYIFFCSQVLLLESLFFSGSVLGFDAFFRGGA